ncbi:hypothetical protein SCB49_10962 [unidentified eubacterium SCB49]|nr:hypothetical protein SCB49_10962 [unidentified eubacterium SCB49]
MMQQKNKTSRFLILLFNLIVLSITASLFFKVFCNPVSDNILIVTIALPILILIWSLQIIFGIKDVKNSIDSPKKLLQYNFVNFTNGLLTGVILLYNYAFLTIRSLFTSSVSQTANWYSIELKGISYLILLIIFLIIQVYLIRRYIKLIKNNL